MTSARPPPARSLPRAAAASAALAAGVALAALLALASCQARRTPDPGPRSVSPAARAVLADADARAGSGREDEAVLLYARAVEADPASVPAHLRHVAALLAAGRRSEARQVYAQRAARPGAAEVDRVMAERLATDGSSSALRQVYAAAAARSPGVVWWHLALAEVEIAEADAWGRRRAAAIESGDREEQKKAWAQARGAVARADLALAAAGRTGTPVAEADLYRGHLRAVEGDLQAGSVARDAAYHAAEQAFARAVRTDSDLVEAWEALGDVRLRTGDTEGGLLALLEATSRRPADATLRMEVGVALHRIGRLREAAEQYREAASLDPRAAEPLLRLGDARADDERWEDALAAYEDALRRDPTAVDAHYKQAVVLEHLGRHGEARVAYERYLAQGGEHSSTVRRRVERLLRAEGTAGAR